MRTRLLVPALFVIASIGSIRGDESPSRVAGLIAKLGSPRFAEREAAGRTLDALGESALDSLRTALKADDAEVRRRAAALVEGIEHRAANARLLQPAAIALNFQDVPLAQAVATLRQETKLDVQLNDRVGRRTVTVVAKPLPVWEALELFCRKAGLSEWDGYSALPPGFTVAQPQAITQQAVGPGGQVIFINRGRIATRVAAGSDGRVLLNDGAAPAVAASHAGSVRVRVLPPSTPFAWTQIAGEDAVVLPLQVSPEVRLTAVNVISATVERALDDRGQTLTVTDLRPEPSPDEQEPMMIAGGQWQMRPARVRGTQIALKVRPGDKPARKLVELRGQLIADVVVADTVATTDAKAPAGTAVAGQFGVTGKVTAVEASDAGPKFALEVDVPPNVALMTGRGVIPTPQVNGAFVIRAVNGNLLEQMDQAAVPPGTTQFGGLSLEDANGKKLEVVGGTWKRTSANGLGGKYQIAVRFRAGDAEPAKLVLTGLRPGAIQVPFAFKDVPLQ